MNEKIQELFEQVADNLDPEDCMVSEEFLEAFTELIVRECVYLCEITAAGKDAEAIQEAIQKHFGVGE